MEKVTITVKEMAEVLSIGLTAAYELVNSEGFYPAFRIGRKLLINVDRLRKWVDEQSSADPQGL